MKQSYIMRQEESAALPVSGEPRLCLCHRFIAAPGGREILLMIVCPILIAMSIGQNSDAVLLRGEKLLSFSPLYNPYITPAEEKT